MSQWHVSHELITTTSPVTAFNPFMRSEIEQYTKDLIENGNLSPGKDSGEEAKRILDGALNQSLVTMVIPIDDWSDLAGEETYKVQNAIQAWVAESYAIPTAMNSYASNDDSIYTVDFVGTPEELADIQNNHY